MFLFVFLFSPYVYAYVNDTTMLWAENLAKFSGIITQEGCLYQWNRVCEESRLHGAVVFIPEQVDIERTEKGKESETTKLRGCQHTGGINIYHRIVRIVGWKDIFIISNRQKESIPKYHSRLRVYGQKIALQDR